MSSEELSQYRRELWEAFSEGQIELLRSLRDDVSSRRWKIMLEIDAIRGYVAGLEESTTDPELKRDLVEVSKRLTEVHRDLSRIPEDIIPPF